MSTNASQELRPVTSLWWLLLVFGVAVLGLGVFFIASPDETLSTISVIVGIFLLVDGVIAIVASIFGKGEGRGLIAIIGVLSAIAGLILIKHPYDTLIFFTLIVGVWFVVAGVVRFVSAFSLDEGRGATIAIALIDLAAGIAILVWPDLGLKTAAVIIGIALVLRGMFFIVAGWQAHKLNNEFKAAAPA